MTSSSPPSSRKPTAQPTMNMIMKTPESASHDEVAASKYLPASQQASSPSVEQPRWALLLFPAGQSAHVLHCDLKPSNVIVTKDDEGHEIIKLVDFGFACTFAPNTKKPNSPKPQNAMKNTSRK